MSDSLRDFIEQDIEYEGYEGPSDSDDSIDDGADCTFYSDATEWDRRVAQAEHDIQGRLLGINRSSRWALQRWAENRRETIATARTLGWVTAPDANEAPTPTSVSSTSPEPGTDEELPGTDDDSTQRRT